MNKNEQVRKHMKSMETYEMLTPNAMARPYPANGLGAFATKAIEKYELVTLHPADGVLVYLGAGGDFIPAEEFASMKALGIVTVYASECPACSGCHLFACQSVPRPPGPCDARDRHTCYAPSKQRAAWRCSRARLAPVSACSACSSRTRAQSSSRTATAPPKP